MALRNCDDTSPFTGSGEYHEAKFDDAKGKEQSFYVDETGKVLKRADEASKSSANAK